MPLQPLRHRETWQMEVETARNRRPGADNSQTRPTTQRRTANNLGVQSDQTETAPRLTVRSYLSDLPTLSCPSQHIRPHRTSTVNMTEERSLEHDREYPRHINSSDQRFKPTDWLLAIYYRNGPFKSRTSEDISESVVVATTDATLSPRVPVSVCTPARPFVRLAVSLCLLA